MEGFYMPPKDSSSTDENSIEWLTGTKMASELNVKPPVLGNWRVRNPDFPQTKKSPSGFFLYNRAAVLDWWEKQGSRPTDRSRELSNMFSGLRFFLDEIDFVLLGLAALCLVKLKKSLKEVRDEGRALVDQEGDVGAILLHVLALPNPFESELAAIWESFAKIDPEEIQEYLAAFDRFPRGRYLQGISPDPLNELIAELVRHKNVDVFDPASGEGGTLLLVAGKIHGEAEGQEIDEHSRQVSLLRAFLLDVTADIRLGDSLIPRPIPESYEVVVSDPPMGLKLSENQRSYSGPFGLVRGDADWAWAQIVASHLKKTGEGYVNLRGGALFQRTSADVRREMIRRGCIEAVISLPPMSASSRVSTALLCLRAPDLNPGASVLMIDAGDVSSRDAEAFKQTIPGLVKKVKSFRANPKGFKGDKKSTVVSVLDLLEDECSLSPARYIARSNKSDLGVVAELRPLLNGIHNSIENISSLNLNDLPTRGIELSHIPLKVLRRENRAEVISGIRVEAPFHGLGIELFESTAPRQWILTVKSMRRPGMLRPNEYVDGDYSDSRAITRPGDIIIMRMGESQAKVDSVGGHLVLSPLSILRLDSTFDPWVVAAALNSDHARKLTVGVGLGRIDLDQLEIPQITSEESEPFQKVLRGLERLESDVEALKNQISNWQKEGGDFIATASQVNI